MVNVVKVRMYRLWSSLPYYIYIMYVQVQWAVVSTEVPTTGLSHAKDMHDQV